MTAPACGSCTAPVSDAYLCAGCTRDLAEQLLIAASIAGDLDDAIAKLLKRGTGGPRSEAEAPLPLDLAASDVTVRLRLCLFRWVGRFLTEDNTAPDEPTIAATARWLASQTSQIRQALDAPEMLRDVRRHVAIALAVIDRQPERTPAGLCPLCRVELFAEIAADTAACPACGYTLTGILARLRERAAAADFLGTPAELTTVLATLGYVVAPGTISGWGTRSQIERRAGGMYRLSDALVMAAKMGTRRARMAG